MHTCSYSDPDTWKSCKPCQDQRYRYSNNRDYENEIDGKGGYFDEIRESEHEYEETMRRAHNWPPRVRSRLL
jgi:hypothetical protein